MLSSFTRPFIHLRSLMAWQAMSISSSEARPARGEKSATPSRLRLNRLSFLRPATGAMLVSSSLSSMLSPYMSGKALQSLAKSSFLTSDKANASCEASSTLPMSALIWLRTLSSTPSEMEKQLPSSSACGAASRGEAIRPMAQSEKRIDLPYMAIP